MLEKAPSGRMRRAKRGKKAGLRLAPSEIPPLLLMLLLMLFPVLVLLPAPAASAQTFDMGIETPRTPGMEESGGGREGWGLWDPWDQEEAWAQEEIRERENNGEEELWELDEVWEPEEAWEAGEVWELRKVENSNEPVADSAGTLPVAEKEASWENQVKAGFQENGKQEMWHVAGRLTSLLESRGDRQSMALTADASGRVGILRKPHEKADLLLSGRVKGRYRLLRQDSRASRGDLEAQGDFEAAEALSVSYQGQIPAVSALAGVGLRKEYFASNGVPEKTRHTETLSARMESPLGVKVRFGYTNRMYPYLPPKSWRSLAANLMAARPLRDAGRVGMACDLRQKTAAQPDTPGLAAQPDTAKPPREYFRQAIRIFWLPDHRSARQVLLYLRGDREGDRYGRGSRWTRWEAAGAGRHRNDEGYAFGWTYRLLGDPGGGTSGRSIAQIFRGMASRKYGTARLSLGLKASYKHFLDEEPGRADYLTRELTAAWEERLSAHWTVGVKGEVSEKYFPGNTAKRSYRSGFRASVRYSF